jgi:hypothetical protein
MQRWVKLRERRPLDISSGIAISLLMFRRTSISRSRGYNATRI